MYAHDSRSTQKIFPCTNIFYSSVTRPSSLLPLITSDFVTSVSLCPVKIPIDCFKFVLCIPWDAKIDRSIDLNMCIWRNIKPVRVISVVVIMAVV